MQSDGHGQQITFGHESTKSQSHDGQETMVIQLVYLALGIIIYIRRNVPDSRCKCTWLPLNTRATAGYSCRSRRDEATAIMSHSILRFSTYSLQTLMADIKFINICPRPSCQMRLAWYPNDYRPAAALQ